MLVSGHPRPHPPFPYPTPVHQGICRCVLPLPSLTPHPDPPFVPQTGLQWVDLCRTFYTGWARITAPIGRSCDRGSSSAPCRPAGASPPSLLPPSAFPCLRYVAYQAGGPLLGSGARVSPHAPRRRLNLELVSASQTSSTLPLPWVHGVPGRSFLRSLSSALTLAPPSQRLDRPSSSALNTFAKHRQYQNRHRLFLFNSSS